MMTKPVRRHTLTPLFWFNVVAWVTHAMLLTALIQRDAIPASVFAPLVAVCLAGDLYMTTLLRKRR